MCNQYLALVYWVGQVEWRCMFFCSVPSTLHPIILSLLLWPGLVTIDVWLWVWFSLMQAPMLLAVYLVLAIAGSLPFEAPNVYEMYEQIADHPYVLVLIFSSRTTTFEEYCPKHTSGSNLFIWCYFLVLLVVCFAFLFNRLIFQSDWETRCSPAAKVSTSHQTCLYVSW